MRLVFTSILLFSSVIVAQVSNNYERYLDSADVTFLRDAKKALSFLDSIPLPLDESIVGKVGKYYLFKGHAYDQDKKQAKMYQSYFLSLKYAENEKDYDIAGDASLELFSNLYFIKKDTTAYKYLDSAKKFYTLAGNKNGLIEVSQMPAYVAFLANEYKKSNTLILEKLNDYKNVEDDAYYYLFATFLLTSNYSHLNDIENSKKYLKEFKSLKSNPTIDLYNYKYYDVSLDICMSHLHLANNDIDSTLHYLSKATELRELIKITSISEYFSLYTEAYKLDGDEEKSRLYLDSLKLFQEKILNENIEASLEINNDFLDAEKALQLQKNKVDKSKNWLFILAILIGVLIFAFAFGYRKFTAKSKDFSLQKKSLMQLQNNNEKIKVRTHELENYITDIKEQFKQIASSQDDDTQKEKIRGLYRNLNAETSNIKNSEENHVSVLKKLNEPFFLKLNKDYPDLTDTDCLVCYYLKLGFMNKEIAFFLGKSVRGIESQRYRISKKMKLENSKDLIPFLNDHY